MLRGKTIKIFPMSEETVRTQAGREFLRVLTGKLQYRSTFLQQYTVHVFQLFPPIRIIKLI